MISSSMSPTQSFSNEVSRKSSLNNSSGMRKKSGLDNVVVCKDLPTKHVHVAALSECGELPVKTVEWMKNVDLQYPAILYCSQETSSTKTQQADLWTAKQYKITPTGRLFIRVFETKLYSGEDKHYQLTLKVGKHSSKSCLSSKTGNVEDWFFIDIDQSADLSSASLEIIMETIPDQQYKQHKQSALLQKASDFISNISRSNTLRRDSFSPTNLPQTGLARLPLAMLINSSYTGQPSLESGGKFILKGFNNQKMGEITLHIAPTEGSIVLGEETKKTCDADEDVILHQAYINYEAKGEWKRFWGILTQDSLILRNIKQRKDEKDSSHISLNDIVKLDLIAGDGQLNAIGLENCLELCFEDNTQLFMYADDEIAASMWADSVSQAAWGQPFSSC